MINGILDLAKVESGRLSLESLSFSPREVVEKAVDTLMIRAREKGLALSARFGPGIPDQVAGDPLRLGQVLINLLGNAIKFTASGQVTVDVERTLEPRAPIGLKFTVTDTGIGIPGDKIAMLFHAFSQADSSTSRKYGGSGLGLAIVARLVALMKGTVSVQSREREGSAFTFTAEFGAPASAHPSTPTAAAVAPRPTESVISPRDEAKEVGRPTGVAIDRPLHILLADDSPDNRALIEAYLKKTPYQLESASDGQEAIDKFIAGRFDLVLMDIQMPNVDGYQATRQIRDWERENHCPRTPVLVLTASALDGADRRTLSAGCDAHITKPVKKATLLNAIRDAMEPKFEGNPSEQYAAPTEVPCRTG